MTPLLRVWLVLAVLLNSAAGAALDEVAQKKSERLAAGCVVTAERSADQPVARYGLTGPAPEAQGVAPENLVFEIGSITKVFTGLLLAQSVVEGKTTLETSLASLLPQARWADPRVGAITLKQLATHTSGLPRLPGDLALGMISQDDPYAHYDTQRLLSWLASAELKSEGPHPCSYSNLGVGVLGCLLGRLHDTSWETLMRDKICLPLGLRDTAVTPRADQQAATPHDGKKAVKPWNLNALGGAGALRSTAADLIRFGEAVLAPEKTPLSAAFALAMQPHAKAPGQGGDIGLGVFIGRFDGQTAFHHDGGTGGYRSSWQVIPALGVVRAVLTSNAQFDSSQVIAGTLSEKAKPAVATLALEEMRAYPGIYDLDEDSRFTVLLRDDALWVRLTGQPFLPVQASAADRFFYKGIDAELVFNREDSKVCSLTLFQNGGELVARRRVDAALPELTWRPAKELGAFTGRYQVMGMKTLTVTQRGRTLFAQLEGQPAFPVFETAPDRFEYDVVEAALVFTRDDARTINGLVLHQNGIPMPAPRLSTEKKTKP